MSCLQGDSGGPLLCLDKDSTWKVYGVSSYVANFCNMTSRPNIFTNVTDLLPWIHDKIGMNYTFFLLVFCFKLCLIESQWTKTLGIYRFKPYLILVLIQTENYPKINQYHKYKQSQSELLIFHSYTIKYACVSHYYIGRDDSYTMLHAN